MLFYYQDLQFRGVCGGERKELIETLQQLVFKQTML